jgi:hypothetical protein
LYINYCLGIAKLKELWHNGTEKMLKNAVRARFGCGIGLFVLLWQVSVSHANVSVTPYETNYCVIFSFVDVGQFNGTDPR